MINKTRNWAAARPYTQNTGKPYSGHHLYPRSKRLPACERFLPSGETSQSNHSHFSPTAN